MSATRFASFRPLRHRNFALVWFGGMVSNIGSWMQTVAVGVLVTQLTHQAHWTGLVAAAAFLPMGLLTPIGGAMADRVDRRMLLLLTTVGETAFATVLAVLAAIHHDSPVAVTLTVLAGGVITALGFPSYQALVPALVPREDLLGAIALGSAQWNFGRVVGPALAGLVLVLGSYTLAFALNAISFFAVIRANWATRSSRCRRMDSATRSVRGRPRSSPRTRAIPPNRVNSSGGSFALTSATSASAVISRRGRPVT